MRFEIKKSVICLLLVNYLMAASCPNMCSGHGSCGKGGVCSCFPGWLEGDCSSRSCPYGHSYVDPTQAPDNYASLPNRASLECSGQGSCDRTSGVCKCFGGFEGVSCDRLSCPNNCNGHGVCTSVKMLGLNEDSHSGSFYESALERIDSSKDQKSNYNGWDADNSYVCVCDGEYRGFDCSEKKCPSGYVENSDCDSPSKSTQTITITQDTTVSPTPTAKDCMAYLEYTDQFNRIWYSDAFCVTCQSKGDKTANYGLCGSTTDGDGQGLILGWEDAIYSLPVGVIDVSKVDVKYSGATDYKITATINFGNQQTGKQNPIRIITSKELDGKTQGAEWCGDCGSGYHGMTIDQLYLDAAGELTDKRKKAEIDKEGFHTPLQYTNPIIAEVDGIPPLECSRNGLCDRTTGTCTCFEGYYGIACTEQASML